MNENLCRICLDENSDSLKSIFVTGKVCGQITKISEMFTECTQIMVEENDGLPNLICNKCLILLSRLFTFRRECLESDTKLRKKYSKEHINNSKEATEETVEYIVLLENSGSIIEESANETNLSKESSAIDKRPSEAIEQKIDTEPRKKKPQPPYDCEICSKTLSNYGSYKNHMLLHSEGNSFLCSECGQGFKTRNAYDGHMATHFSTYKCDICNKSYRQAATLKSHKLTTHQNVKPFSCDICEKGFTQKSGFKKHMLIHTEEKPYVCDNCGKHFRHSSNLIMHKRKHTGDRPYECKVCSKKFSGSESLKRHSIIHTNLKPFTCDVCSKSFNRKSTLLVHKNVHAENKNKKHDCNICNKSFTQLSCLKSHMTQHVVTND